MEELSPRQKVHNIFKDFFGEDRVDIQGRAIIIHFPKVTVTNENDRSIDITELWVKVEIDGDGCIDGTFTFMRSEYTDVQFRSGYGHSHMPPIDASNFDSWLSPCLGGGPIRHTIAALSSGFSEEMWQLFCLELSKYVTVESLGGIPYRCLERVGNINDNSREVTEYTGEVRVYGNNVIKPEIEFVNKFIPYVILKKPFKFNYVDGAYGIAMPYNKLLVILSNLFIKWHNALPNDLKYSEEILYSKIISKGKYFNNKLYYIVNPSNSSNNDSRPLEGTLLFTFKGEQIKFHIAETPSGEDQNTAILLKPNIVTVLIDRILKIVNHRHGKEDIITSGETFYYL